MRRFVATLLLVFGALVLAPSSAPAASARVPFCTGDLSPDCAQIACFATQPCDPVQVSTPATRYRVEVSSGASDIVLGAILNGTRVGDDTAALGPLDCPGYQERSAAWVQVLVSPEDGAADRTKTMTRFIVNPSLLDVAVGLLWADQACFGAPYTFRTRLGFPALRNIGGEYVGILPECGLLTTPPDPCVSRRTTVPFGSARQVALQIRVPPHPRDPRFRG